METPGESYATFMLPTQLGDRVKIPLGSWLVGHSHVEPLQIPTIGLAKTCPP